MSWLNRPLLAVAATLVAASPAWACPVCNSATGQRVRDRILDNDFGHNLIVTALPFAVFLAVAVVLHFGVPWRLHGTNPTIPADPPSPVPLRRPGT